MPSRQDQLHSYQFAVQRVVAALVMRETDPAQSPFRRAAGATLASVLIAAIALGAVGVYGLLTGGGASQRWRTSSSVIVDRDSGARYVYLDGKLHPVVNQASALLIVGSSSQKPVGVSRKSIAGVPRGVPLGIPNAPDPLPAVNAMVRYPWTVCSATVPGSEGSRSTMLVGAGPRAGSALGDRGLLARHPDGGIHLLWNNRRHLIRDTATVRVALGWTSQPVLPVAPALINSLPAGADLELIDIPGRGEPFRFLPGAQVGQVFVREGQAQAADTYAVALRDGLAGITQVQSALLLADPATRARVRRAEPTPLSLSDFAAIPDLPSLAPEGAAPPTTTPELATVDAGAVCAVVRDDAGVSDVTIESAVPDVSDAAATGAASAQGGVLADHVRVQPGRGAVVEAMPSPGAESGTLFVVTDIGRRYAVPSVEALRALGFGGVKPVRVPAGLVALLPPGPALDPAAAREPVGQG